MVTPSLYLRVTLAGIGLALAGAARVVANSYFRFFPVAHSVMNYHFNWLRVGGHTLFDVRTVILP